MDETEEYISNLTLEYLMNKEQYAKYLDQKNPMIKKSNKKDKKFYRRRIFELTKQLLNNEIPENLMNDVKIAFDNYVKSSINFFKVLDKADIIQEDYTDLEIDIKNDINIDNIDNTEEANQLMMRSIKMPHTPTLLDNFIIVKNANNYKNEPIIPKQKDINLKDPNLKNKGIRKKKNITNNYDKDTN